MLDQQQEQVQLNGTEDENIAKLVVKGLLYGMTDSTNRILKHPINLMISKFSSVISQIYCHLVKTTADHQLIKDLLQDI